MMHPTLCINQLWLPAQARLSCPSEWTKLFRAIASYVMPSGDKIPGQLADTTSRPRSPWTCVRHETALLQRCLSALWSVPEGLESVRPRLPGPACMFAIARRSDRAAAPESAKKRGATARPKGYMHSSPFTACTASTVAGSLLGARPDQIPRAAAGLLARCEWWPR